MLRALVLNFVTFVCVICIRVHCLFSRRWARYGAHKPTYTNFPAPMQCGHCNITCSFTDAWSSIVLCFVIVTLILYMLNFSEVTIHISTFYVIPSHWHDRKSWNPSWSKTKTYQFYRINIVAADVLATQRAHKPTYTNFPAPYPMWSLQYNMFLYRCASLYCALFCYCQFNSL